MSIYGIKCEAINLRVKIVFLEQYIIYMLLKYNQRFDLTKVQKKTQNPISLSIGNTISSGPETVA